MPAPRHVAALALVLSAAAAAAARQGDFVLYDDVQVPLHRHYRGLGATTVDHETLWPGGRVNYYIDTTATSQYAPSPDGPHDAEDVAMILAAVAHWEEKTCLRFTRCASAGGCAKPYLQFQSAKDTCSSPVGVQKWWGMVNNIYMAKSCGYGAAVHEIGHSVGLQHEQTRNDRDEYVVIDEREIKANSKHNFYKNGPDGRDIGPYDYNSIMHYNVHAFAKNYPTPVMVAPVAVGQRSALSVGDVASIHFMYNDCKAKFDAPRCVASKDEAARHLIPYGRAFKVEVDAVYDSYMRVGYEGTTAAASQTSFSKAAGHRFQKTARADISFTPRRSDAGKTFVLSARFTGSAGAAAECSVEVEVAPSTAVCFGAPGDAGCNGRGTCRNGPVCACDAGFAGPMCEATDACSKNTAFDFDGEDDLKRWWVDADVSAVQSGMWRVGGEQAYASLSVGAGVKPEKVSYALQWRSGERPNLSFNGNGEACFFLPIYHGYLYAGKYGPQVFAGRTYRFEHRIDWAARTVDHYVDGRRVFTDVAFDSRCPDGISSVVFWGPGSLGSFDMPCTDLPTATPAPVPRAPATPLPPTPAPTPSPPTPAPTPSPPTPRPATPQPPAPGACEDTKSYCPDYEHLCVHSSVRRDCPLTCGACTDGAPTPEPSTAVLPVPVPPTTAPPTVAPPTAAPPTPVPATPVPTTPTPQVLEPPTPEPPATPAPSAGSCKDHEEYCPQYAHLCRFSSVQADCPLTCEVCA